ncbi:MAG TPA: hypothetical protein VF735_18715 [Pyrinomonadaceae bacterium]|jgi:hypothetical protein
MSSQISSNDESATSALDWRAQINEHPLAYSAGAMLAGLAVGYCIAGTFGSESRERSLDNTSDLSEQHAFYASGRQDWPMAEESNKPGLIEKFKTTQAFDRLQEEVSKLGDRLMSELSRVGQEVVLPAITGKIAELVRTDAAPQTPAGQSSRAQGIS